MRTELHWIAGPWPGRLAMMSRPRGGDWLEDEIQFWRRAGVEVIVSLLSHDEQTELNLPDEEAICRANGVEYVSFPIVDRSVPVSTDGFAELLTGLVEQLANGKSIAVHCRQGIGRSALVAIGLMILSGMRPAPAIEHVSAARGCAVPETSEQRQWITDFSESLLSGATK